MTIERQKEKGANRQDEGEDPRLVYEYLRGVPLFSKLREDRFQTLTKLLHGRRFPKGSVLMSKGEDSTFMLILTKGRVEVYDRRNGEDILLTVQGPGTSIGELGLIDGRARSAYVRTVEECQGLVLERQDFAKLTQKDPHILWGLVRNLSERLRESGATIAQLSNGDPDDQTTPSTEPSPHQHEATPAASPPVAAPSKAATTAKKDDEDKPFGQDLQSALLGLGSAAFGLAASVLVYESQRPLRLLRGEDSIVETLEQQDKLLGAVTEAIEGQMDTATKGAQSRFQELLGSLASLLDN